MSEPQVIPGIGEYGPWFRAPALSGSDNYNFALSAGRHVILLFLGSAGQPPSAAALALIERNRALFDDDHACIFGVTIDPGDAEAGRIAQSLPGVRFFLDYDGRISRLYGALRADNRYEPHWVILDRELRIRSRYRIGDGEAALADLRQRIATRVDGWAPVLTIPEVLNPETCRQLIDLYETQGGTPSGFMRDIDGRTTVVVDPEFKQRSDHVIEDDALRQFLVARVQRHIVPAIERAFHFKATRIERYLVACYQAGAGHFRQHRDNTTFGTAHRRFAVTINLNAEEYEGGDLRFPEFGERTYRAPTGGAIVFSCSLLHEATPVTQGKRYAFLPFLYDEAAKELRDANLHKLDMPTVGGDAPGD
jgi:predicted 2-oxoglutarate/Fe(II)-dependent dioxygenase YbiX/peroxiredoxin